jgi:hypothetical protein
MYLLFYVDITEKRIDDYSAFDTKIYLAKKQSNQNRNVVLKLMFIDTPEEVALAKNEENFLRKLNGKDFFVNLVNVFELKIKKFFFFFFFL